MSKNTTKNKKPSIEAISAAFGEFTTDCLVGKEQAAWNLMNKEGLSAVYEKYDFGCSEACECDLDEQLANKIREYAFNEDRLNEGKKAIAKLAEIEAQTKKVAKPTHKFYVCTIEERNGEYNYTHYIKMKLSLRQKPEKALDNVTKTWYADDAEKDEYGYYFNGGCVFVNPGDIHEVTEDVFNVVNRFINTL
jgi:hypothetical protein